MTFLKRLHARNARRRAQARYDAAVAKSGRRSDDAEKLRYRLMEATNECLRLGA